MRKLISTAVALVATLAIIGAAPAADARDSGWNGTVSCARC